MDSVETPKTVALLVQVQKVTNSEDTLMLRKWLTLKMDSQRCKLHIETSQICRNENKDVNFWTPQGTKSRLYSAWCMIKEIYNWYKDKQTAYYKIALNSIHEYMS